MVTLKNGVRIGAAIVTLITGLVHLVLDSLIVACHNCSLTFEEPQSIQNVSIFKWFYMQYLADDSCKFESGTTVDGYYLYCDNDTLLASETNPNNFNNKDNVFIWTLVHLVLVSIWSGFSIMAFWDRLKIGWQVSTIIVLLYSLLAAIVLAIDLDITIPLLNCEEETDSDFNPSDLLVSSLILPIYFFQGGLVWFIILGLWITALVVQKNGAPNRIKNNNNNKKYGRSLSDAPSELYMNRLSKRYMDPAKVNADQNPMTKSNGHPVQGSFAQPTYAVPEIDKPRVIGRKLSDDYIMLPRKSYDNEAFRETEQPLSASNLGSRPNMPDQNPVHRVFITKKPSLRRNSNSEMKSFGDRRSNPNSGFSSESERGSPVNRRYGSYPSSPVSPIPIPMPVPMRPTSPVLSNGNYPAQIPSIPMADYSPPNARPKLIAKSFDNVGQRKDKAPRKAIRTPSGRSYTATEYLRGYTPGHASLKEEEDDGTVRYLIGLKR